MIFMHIVDDYYLQGILAKMKQKKWWKENAPEEMYKDDWAIALFMHAFSWTFMVMLPIAYAHAFDVGIWFKVVFIINVIVHGLTDHLKANVKSINLVADQSIHLLQILATYTFLILLY
jgi:hypothetical protein